MSMVYIGIDPGVSGGIAVISDRPSFLSPTLKFKDATEDDIENWLDLHTEHQQRFAFIERVSSSPQMGVVSAFTFGKSYGFLRGILTGLEIAFEEISPQKWQKAMGCLTRGDKNVSKAKAQQLFPQLKITHAVADAILLAEYCRRTCNARNGT